MERYLQVLRLEDLEDKVQITVMYLSNDAMLWDWRLAEAEK